MTSSLARFTPSQKRAIIRAFLRVRHAPAEESRDHGPSLARYKAILQKYDVNLGEEAAFERLALTK